MLARRCQPLVFVVALAAPLFAPAGSARATPPAGAAAAAVAVEDTTGARWPLPDARLPILVIYEDQKAQDQNLRAHDVIGKIDDDPANRGRWRLMAVADLEKWNWWPAKRYALDDLRKIAAREKTTLWCDWTGAVRRAWGLQKSKSGYILVGADGKIRFAAEGPLSPAQLRELVRQIAALGLSVPAAS